LVVADQLVGAAKDRRERAVVLLELDRHRRREVQVEAEDVGDLGAAPAVDRLVVVADHAQVLARAGEPAHHLELGAVGVLILVDHQVLNLACQ
jgi:hypothetical protein